LNFQTLVQDLTGMAMSGASLLDEATAAAEAMALCANFSKNINEGHVTVFASDLLHPQSIALLKVRPNSFFSALSSAISFPSSMCRPVLSPWAGRCKLVMFPS
jgi:glycine cleavage system pyridoxal-binding protein P